MSRGVVRVALPLGIVMVLAVAVTLVEGAPARLPGVALGSTVLVHAERAAALFAVSVAVISVLAQAARGRLPTQLSTSGIAYDVEETRQTTTALDELQHEMDRQRVTLRQLAERLDAIDPNA